MTKLKTSPFRYMNFHVNKVIYLYAFDLAVL